MKPNPAAELQARAASLVGDAYVAGFEAGLARGGEKTRLEVALELEELRDIASTLMRHVAEDCVPTTNASVGDECLARLRRLGVTVDGGDVLLRVGEAKAALVRALPGVRVPKKWFGEIVYHTSDCQFAAFIGADGAVNYSLVGGVESVREEFVRRCDAWGAAITGPTSPSETSSMRKI